MMRAFESVRKNIENQVNDTDTQDKSKLLYELDARQKRTLELFMKQKVIKAADVGLILGVSTRAANNLCKTWIEQDFITPTHQGKRGRGYTLGEKFEGLVV